MSHLAPAFISVMSRQALLLVPLLLTACASGPRYIRGTQVPDTVENRDILKVIERYRVAVERRDASALLGMASPQYYEDGGTPTGSDDYGYEGLREVLTSRFQKAEQVRFSMRYVSIRKQEKRAFVDVIVDASYSVPTDRGVSRLDMRDQNQLVLEHDGRSWRFLSGM
jgi:hypothetical protein